MKKHVPGFDLTSIDAHVRPQDDFFEYANGGWFRQNPIPASEARWGSFITLSHQTEKQLRAILDGIAKQRGLAHGSPEQQVRDYFRAGMDMKRRNALGARPLAPWQNMIEGIKTPEDLHKLIAAFHRLGIGVLWGTMVDQDAKKSTRYLLHLVQDGLGMPDRDYYLKDDAESRRVREAYRTHVANMFRLLGYSPREAASMRDSVLDIETKLAQISMDKVDARDADKTYHKKTLVQLQTYAPAVDWEAYLKRSGAPAVRDLILMQPVFVQKAAALTRSIPLSAWKAYLHWHLASDMSGSLSQPFLRESFNFYGKALSGRTKMKPLWRQVLASTNGALGEPLGRMYVKKHFGSEAKRKMNLLVDDLFEAYEARIKHLDWMSPETKKKAQQKLKAMRRKIGYPDKWRSYRALKIVPDDFLGNAVRSSEFEHKRMMRKLSRSVDREEWFMDPQMVNAYFCPTLNDIAFPAAILQPPFFNLHADDAFNYGAIGAVIGHEITHGFDDQGAKFDGAGNMRKWWTPADRKRFDTKGAVLAKQFDQYEVAPGSNVNGKLTLGENIADLGGVAIAFDAYQRRLERTERKNIDGLTPEQRFFLGFAASERMHARPEYLKTQVATDPHSPSPFRVNGPVSNLQEFYDAFGVKRGDTLYREPKARAKIW